MLCANLLGSCHIEHVATRARSRKSELFGISSLTVLTTSSRLSKMLLYSRAFAIRVCCFETEADSTGCYLVNNKFGRLLTVANNDEIFLAVAIFARDYTSAAAETIIVVNIRNLNGFVFTWF